MTRKTRFEQIAGFRPHPTLPAHASLTNRKILRQLRQKAKLDSEDTAPTNKRNCNHLRHINLTYHRRDWI
jgi:hypothetical protein